MAQIKDVYGELGKFKKKLRRGEPEIFDREAGVLTAGMKKKGKLSKK